MRAYSAASAEPVVRAKLTSLARLALSHIN
jgi:hypothetical protein